MKQAILAVIDILTEMKPLSPTHLRSNFEVKTRGAISVFRYVSYGFSVLLVPLCFILFVSQPRLNHDLGLAIAILATACLSAVCMAISMVLGMLPIREMLIFPRRDDVRRQRLTAKYDFAHVSSLTQQSLPTLQFAKQWISKEIDRVNARPIGFFGSPEKMALASLAPLAWTVWSEGVTKSGGAISFPVQMLLALLVAAAIGALISRDRLAQLVYLRELLSLAILQVEAEVANDRSKAAAMHPGTLSVADIEARFKGRGPWKRSLPRILETLEAFRRARREGEFWRS
ncbi:MAG: hypothetical protein H7346_21825 [Burkholderiaceae bacterium]|nr:hypothetical protein [Burkholderiaceae bacterium]